MGTLGEQLENPEKFIDYVIMDKPNLDGTARPIKGAWPIAIQAHKENFTGLILPKENAREAAMAGGLLFPFDLFQALNCLK
jgi:magnesium chelatase family protein